MAESATSVVDTFGQTLRPNQSGLVSGMPEMADQSHSSELSSMKLSGGLQVGADEEEDALDVRAGQVSLEMQYVDMPSKDVQVIMKCALRAYNTHVFEPTRTTWRKEEGSRRELERDVERTALSRIAEDIKREVTTKLGGGCWHVIYGHDFATYVTHKRLNFCHFQIEGADVVVWRYGG